MTDLSLIPTYTLNIHLTKANQSVTITRGLSGTKCVRLTAYSVFGALTTQPMFFRIKNQNMLTNPTNMPVGEHSVMMLLPSAPDCTVFLHYYVPITNLDNFFNDSHQIEFEVVDSNNQPAVFTDIYLEFRLMNHQQMLGVSNPIMDRYKQQGYNFE